MRLARGRARLVADALSRYKEKRDFAATPEPKGKPRQATGDRFCVQKHDARRLHFDLRLELDGVLKSWAVTRGPSLVPGEKRLAVHTEDHPLEYLTFEGVIPKGEYGGGTMIVWDQGRWTPQGDPHKGYAKGHLDFELDGERLKGRWHLVRMRPRPREKKEQWLLLKGDDEFARNRRRRLRSPRRRPTSVISRDEPTTSLPRSGEVREDHAARAQSEGRRDESHRPLSRGCAGREERLAPGLPGAEPCYAWPPRPRTATSGSTRSSSTATACRRASTETAVKLLTRKGLDWTAKFRPASPRRCRS